MRVLVAGASGVLGRRLVPMLVGAGHEVVGTTRTQTKVELLRALGARPVVLDALDRDAVLRAVDEARPEVVVHQLTALPDMIDPRRLAKDFALTNRLRTEGTDHLLAAAREAAVRRFVAQGFAGWTVPMVERAARNAAVGAAEERRLDERPGGGDPAIGAALPDGLRRLIAALRHLEDAVTGAEWTEGVVLRYGLFYGPGTSFDFDPPGAQIKLIRRRGFPIIGDGAGEWSFVHVDDAASATVDAIDRARRGIYDIVDDEPARVADWLPVLAEAAGARPPFRLPHRLGRLLTGRTTTLILTATRGASNAAARDEFGWRPRYASWREGFEAVSRPSPGAAS